MGKELPTVTLAEAGKHNTADDLWVVIGDAAYDVTKFQSKHPGGATILKSMGGKDTTDAFQAFHPEEVERKWLPAYKVARVSDNKPGPVIADFRALRQRIIDAGLFEPNYNYFVFKHVYILSIFFLSMYTLFSVPAADLTYGRVLASAFLLAVFWQQYAFLGHDLCHNGVTGERKLDYGWSRSSGNLLMGISSGWWKRSHNQHHIVCNSIEHDCDIQHLPFLAVSERFFGSPFSFFHEHQLSFDFLAKFLVRFQHVLYYPIMSLARVNLYAQSILHLTTRRYVVENRWEELAGMAGFFLWYTLCMVYLPTNGLRAAFFFGSHMPAGILHVQIVLSHFSMGVYSGVSYTDNEYDGFPQTQLATSMDIECTPLNSWFHGGLQYQVEHHMFPRLPRHNLKYIKPWVRDFAKKHKLVYRSLGFFEANAEVIGHLKKVASNIDTPGADVNASLCFLKDAVNAQG